QAPATPCWRTPATSAWSAVPTSSHALWKNSSMRLTLSGPAGPLEAILDEPQENFELQTSNVERRSGGLRAAVVFAPPLPTHGGTMHTKAVYQGAKGLRRIGCAVLRFNFRG